MTNWSLLLTFNKVNYTVQAIYYFLNNPNIALIN